MLSGCKATLPQYKATLSDYRETQSTEHHCQRTGQHCPSTRQKLSEYKATSSKYSTTQPEYKAIQHGHRVGQHCQCKAVLSADSARWSEQAFLLFLFLSSLWTYEPLWEGSLCTWRKSSISNGNCSKQLKN